MALAQSDVHAPRSAINGFAAKVSAYFLDFLATDFKKQAAPKRRIQHKTDGGFRAGFRLNAYPPLNRALRELLNKPVNNGLKFDIARGTYKSQINPVIADFIRRQVDAIEGASWESVRKDFMDAVIGDRALGIEDPEKYIGGVLTVLEHALTNKVIEPLLTTLDKTFQAQSYAAIESAFEVQVDLLGDLCSAIREQIPTVLNQYVISGDLAPVEHMLSEFLTEEEATQQIKAFFEGFATSDAFQEMRDLVTYLRNGGDNLQLYLYMGDIRIGTYFYPVCYIPVEYAMDESHKTFQLEFQPNLYVHKRALDFVAQELESNAAIRSLVAIDGRMTRVSDKESFLVAMKPIFARIENAFDLNGNVVLGEASSTEAKSSSIRLSNTLHFAVFDRSDESVLNDYEALLRALQADSEATAELFEDVIRGFIEENPVYVGKDIEDEWDRTPVTERLVAHSPIPLNEEQRKLIQALRNGRSRFLIVQGPPGCGKSHSITAIAFDSILEGKSILILSDKAEALDVVEDKLRETLAQVRGSSEFPDPILRLGKATNNFHKLVAADSVQRIRLHDQAGRSQKLAFEQETADTETRLKQGIIQTVQALSGISLKEVEELHAIESRIDAKVPGLTEALRHPEGDAQLSRLAEMMQGLGDLQPAYTFFTQRFQQGPLRLLQATVRAYAVVTLVPSLHNKKTLLGTFTYLGHEHIGLLNSVILDYQALRLPILGFLFRGRAVRELNARVGGLLPCPITADLHRRLPDLHHILEAVVIIQRTVDEQGLPQDVVAAAYRLLLKDAVEINESLKLRRILELVSLVLGTRSTLLEHLAVDGRSFRNAGELLAFIVGAARYTVLWHKISAAMAKIPDFDYMADKTRLEQLFAGKMMRKLDERFLAFYDNKKNDAISLGKVIKAKQQFPQDKFDDLKEALPCVIASLRDFADYVPLRARLFDIVIIDEASQVSVAQAFPALLRGKKVVVFGDKKQFSNVKSSNASIVQNQRHLTDLDRYFRAHIGDAAIKVARLKHFDVKRSVLDFFELISNYETLLVKHFRSYQELISFSSKHFYGNTLQAVKIRPTPIDQVIEFTVVNGDLAPREDRNTNHAEARFILEALREMVEQGQEVTVGIITPFNEQRAYLSKLLFSDALSPRFEEDLKLKVWTFDTAQGDERQVIFYSFVATEERDRLNYVFPLTLDAITEDVSEKLKLQRLNVGMSRAQEKIHFVLSKPVDRYRGSVLKLLQHYQSILTDKRLPERGETDPNSPMERQVLDWLSKAKFVNDNIDRIEVRAQFPIGEVLRQIDPSYTHPAYRCDFLLMFRADNETLKIVIEYDGFAEHFVSHGKIHRGNYDQYYKPEDLERQWILESYGYRFIRINRFSVGRDPVKTLSERIEKLVRDAGTNNDAATIRNVRAAVEDLETGDAKRCGECKEIKPKQAFFDKELGGGRGGHGRLCIDCKSKKRRAGSAKYSGSWAGRRN